MDTIPKPDELLALHTVTEELFDTLRVWFDVPEQVTLELGDIDAAVEQLGDPQMIAATAMRKLQALRLLATPGVRTSTDVVVSIVQDLDRALVQAPAMRLKRVAATTDWDAALADLVRPEATGEGRGDGLLDGPADGPVDGPRQGPVAGPADEADPTHEPPPAAAAGDDDETVQRFRSLHGRLHQAVHAVLQASDGEIRYLV